MKVNRIEKFQVKGVVINMQITNFFEPIRFFQQAFTLVIPVAVNY